MRVSKIGMEDSQNSVRSQISIGGEQESWQLEDPAVLHTAAASYIVTQ